MSHRPTFRKNYLDPFTLYGGTATALRLGHRSSADFDFFASSTPKPGQLLEALPFLKAGQIIQDEPGAKSYYVSVDGKDAKLSFFYGLTMGRVGEPSITPDGIVLLASPDDFWVSPL